MHSNASCLRPELKHHFRTSNLNRDIRLSISISNQLNI